ncbi:MAG: ABC transporter permease [Chitinophagales bacterium]|nr:ABC transporter permease [Chitinophagales bacterium]
MMILKIAWRNIWRNRTRSLVLILSIVLGMWAGAFIMAFYWGMSKQQVDDTIQQNLSHIQFHHPDFRENFEAKYTIADGDQVVADLQQDKEVKAYSERVVCMAMAASASKSTGVTLYGIVPEQEDALTGLKEKLIAGDYFTGKKNEVVVGNKLAEKLHLDVRKKIVCTFQDEQGEIVSVALRVSGIFKTRNSRLEEGMIYMQQTDLSALLGTGNGIHEIAVLLADDQQVDAVTDQWKQDFPADDVESWKELSPELRLIVESFNQYMFIIIGIILLALLFGIINTMLMAILERTKELGVLMSVGLNKTKVFIMILLETVFIALVGGPLGLLLAWCTVQLTHSSGIDLSMYSKGLEEFGYASIVYPELGMSSYFSILIMVVAAALIASVFPAMRALKLKPVEAIRKI